MLRIRLTLILSIEAALILLLAGSAFLQAGPGDPYGKGPAMGPPGPTPAKGRSGDDGPRLGGRGPGEDESSRGGMHVAPMFRDLTDEEIAKILAFVSEDMPWLKGELEKARDADQPRFRQMCRHLRFDIAQLEKLKAADAAAFRSAIEERRLRYLAGELAARIRAATDPKERETLREDLRKQVDQLFDIETANRNATIRQIEAELESLRKAIKDRIGARKDIVEKRVDDLVKGRPEGPPAPPAPPGMTPPTKPAAPPDASPPPARTEKPAPTSAEKAPAPEKTPPPPAAK
jgi:hypothetical protein